MESRTFSIEMLSYGNGRFASISEGEPSIGSLVVSLYNRSTPVTTQVIPSGAHLPFMRLIAEKLAVRSDGVAILSVNVRTDLPSDIVRELIKHMDEIT